MKRRTPLITLGIVSLFLIFTILTNANSNDVAAVATNFTLLDDFGARLNGNIHNQGSWVANEPGAAAGAIVVAAPPRFFSGKALQNDPRETLSRGNAYLPLGPNEIDSNNVGTLYVQLALDDKSNSNFSIGLSSLNEPNIYSNSGIDDFTIEVNFGRDGLRVRNGSSYETTTNITLQNNALYHVWIVANNENSTFQLWIDSSNQTAPVQATTASGDRFSFRQSSTGPLKTFALQNVGLNSGISYIDAMYIQPTATDLSYPGPRFLQVDTFETLSIGGLADQNGWQSTGNVQVMNDPNGSDNKTLSLDNENDTAFKSVGDGVLNNDSGTLYFRLLRQQSIDAFAGLSDILVPAEWSDFETQVGVNNSAPTDFVVRDEANFRTLNGGFVENSWYCVWIVASNSTDTYEVYLRGAQFSDITRLQSEQLSAFVFRNGSTTDPLRTFYARTGVDRGGKFYIDDIYIDSNSKNFSSPSADCQSQVPPATPTPITNGTATPQATATPNSQPTLDPNQPLDDPIPERIEVDGSTVQFRTIATLPQTATGEVLPRTNPRTRVNFLYHARDGSGRLFANDLRGQLYVVDPDSGDVGLYLNLKPYFSNWFEISGLNSGFSTFTFHPEYAHNGLFYTIHTEEPNGAPDYRTFNPQPIVTHGVLMEWNANVPSANEFSGTRRELLRIAQASTAHGMQQAQFNPNAVPGDADYGLLYVSNGDGENSPHFSDAAQNLGSLQGTVFRIDPLGNNSLNGQYGIPTSNPYASSNDSAILKEIYAYGFRNPNRFTWDAGGNRKMLLANIGQNNIDELELVEPALNYGWNEREGTFRFDIDNPNQVYPLPSNDTSNGFTYPVAQYDHDEGYAIQGGFVYRGSLMPTMQGIYIFGDIVLGHLFYVHVDQLSLGNQAEIHKLTLLNENGDIVAFKQLVDPSNQRADLRFGLDEENEIYILSKQDGVIRRLVSGSRPQSPPATQTVAPTATFVPSSTPIPMPTATVPTMTVTLVTPGNTPENTVTPEPSTPTKMATVEASATALPSVTAGVTDVSTQAPQTTATTTVTTPTTPVPTTNGTSLPNSTPTPTHRAPQTEIADTPTIVASTIVPTTLVTPTMNDTPTANETPVPTQNIMPLTATATVEAPSNNATSSPVPTDNGPIEGTPVETAVGQQGTPVTIDQRVDEFYFPFIGHP